MSILDRQPRVISLSIDGINELVAKDLGVPLSRVSVHFVTDQRGIVKTMNVTVHPEPARRTSVSASQFEDRTSQRD
jgi:hypothetical protein